MPILTLRNERRLLEEGALLDCLLAIDDDFELEALRRDVLVDIRLNAGSTSDVFAFKSHQ